MLGAAQPKPSSAPSREAVWRRYREVRAESERLAAPLATEDYVIQAMPDVSPPKWHLAHITWFFEHFIAAPYARAFAPFHPRVRLSLQLVLRDHRTVLPAPRARICSRVPTVEEVFRYRAHVDRVIGDVIDAVGDQDWDEVARRIELGLHHEQQHQELLLTDLKFNFAFNPLQPAYRPPLERSPATTTRPVGWIDFDAGIRLIGYEGREFAFDNERPRHRVFLEPFRSPTAWSRAASTSRSSTTTDTPGPTCGCRKAGRRSRNEAGQRRSTGSGWTASGRR